MADNEHSRSPEQIRDGESENDSAILLQSVSAALNCDASKNVFAIGGTVKARNPHSPSLVDRGVVTIRWDSNEGRGHKVSLPVEDDSEPSLNFQKLLRDCQPATFGRGKSTVLDEGYRKAGTIDTTNFCTDFSLAENEILATIIQTLGQGCVPRGNYNGIRAEMYKLNVGRFELDRSQDH
jgi:hypothetical protein